MTTDAEALSRTVMEQRKVMQQALEALETFTTWERGQDYMGTRADVLRMADEAQNALREALEGKA